MCAKKPPTLPGVPSHGMAASLILYRTESRHPSAALGSLMLKSDKNPKPPKDPTSPRRGKLILGIDEDRRGGSAALSPAYSGRGPELGFQHPGYTASHSCTSGGPTSSDSVDTRYMCGAQTYVQAQYIKVVSMH